MPVSFFCKTSASNIWKCVTGVSSAGSKRGRGKGTGRAIVKDFNRGQQIGVGRKKLVLAGLNSPVVSGHKFNDIQDVGKHEDFETKLQTVRNEMNTYKKFREIPLDRGWSGRRAHGRRAGQPDDYNETSFEGFDSTVLMLRPMQSMSGILGRIRRMQALVVTGNKNGLAGFSTSIGKDPKAVVRRAKNRAAQTLVHVPRWENHTVLHDFYSRYYFTTVFVERKPKGYGIRAHRIVKAICEVLGITDLYVKVEGKTRNPINLTKAFFLGLMNQRSYEDMAEEKKLHLVELREENFYYPQILASPKSEILSDDQLKSSRDNLDFTYYIFDGKVRMIKPKSKHHFDQTPTWYKHLDKQDYVKNREKTKLLLAAKYGDTNVKDVFPYFKTTASSFNKAD